MTAPTAAVHGLLKHRIKPNDPEPLLQEPLFDMADRLGCCWEMQSRGGALPLYSIVKAELIVSLSTSTVDKSTLTCVCSSPLGQITKLKIDRNPFAKGFRDPGRNRYSKLSLNAEHKHFLFSWKCSTKGPKRDLKFNHWNLKPHKTYK